MTPELMSEGSDLWYFGNVNSISKVLPRSREAGKWCKVTEEFSPFEVKNVSCH